MQSNPPNIGPKFIFVTGGVLSGLGKGVITSSVAKLLLVAGYKASCVKIDPYVNYDAGTMNPVAHGEVFVTDDGGECDMDIGNYERFTDTALTKDHNITTGRVYLDVIKAEREGEYLGQCVQIIPHVTDAIKNALKRIASLENLDVTVVECGGTVGDIESLPFLEAFRQMELELGHASTLFVHVTLAPVLDVVGEQKTKPTQHSVQELRRIGIQPDLLAIRCKTPLSADAARKISLFASVPQECVISCHDAPSIYKVPEILAEQNMLQAIATRLALRRVVPRWGTWKHVADSFAKNFGKLRIAAVGKYVTLPDSYVSVYHALSHAGAHIERKAEIDWIDSERFENGSESKLKELQAYDGILCPGGFGNRGSDGIILVADYARRKNIPYLGICFGFQLAIVAFARHVCGLKDANSTELDAHTPFPVVDFMPEQRDIHDMGGTMRLGAHEISIMPKTNAMLYYGSARITRRHRHRYEFNQQFQNQLEKAGLVFSAYSDSGRRTEIFELPDSRFYFGIQYHGEFSSRPGRPEQAFESFVKACAGVKA